MNLVKFIDCRFQELRIREQQEDLRKEYVLARDSEVLALQWVLASYRALMKWLLVPKVFIHFIGVKLGLCRTPEPVLLNQMAAAQKNAFNKKAKSVGMLDRALSKDEERELAQ